MRFVDALHAAGRGVTSNPLRSLLTMLGIIIGVGSVVLMTSIGASVEQVILGQVSTLGAQSMIIIPGNDQQGGPPITDTLKIDDANALRGLSTIQTVAPVIIVDSDVRYGREVSSPQILATTEDFFQNQSMTVDRGRLLDRHDEQGARFVAVLGPDVADNLFGEDDPLGKRIHILDRGFTVIGILDPVGTQFFQSIDERIYIPLVLVQVLTGQRHANFITLQARESIEIAKLDIEALLRERHHIRNPVEEPDENDDFHVHSAEQATQMLGAVSFALTALLTTIAAISLVVGGIGIMNIMLVVVTERTREIGLRKALGARKRDILLQFLIEAILLTSIGGILGVICGVLFAFIGSAVASRFLASYAFTVTVPSALLALGVSAVVGLVFGIYPARKAAILSPMEALRYE